MKKYRVQGYIPSGLHRWKLVDRVVDVYDPNPTEDSAIGAWLISIELKEEKCIIHYEIKSIEEVND